MYIDSEYVKKSDKDLSNMLNELNMEVKQHLKLIAEKS